MSRIPSFAICSSLLLIGFANGEGGKCWSWTWDLLGDIRNIIEDHLLAKYLSFYRLGEELLLCDTISLRAWQGQYVAAEYNGAAMANRDSVGKKGRWKVVQKGDKIVNIFILKSNMS